MPDPVGEARERLERIAAGETEYAVYVRGQKLRVGQSGIDPLRADISAVLAALPQEGVRETTLGCLRQWCKARAMECGDKAQDASLASGLQLGWAMSADTFACVIERIDDMDPANASDGAAPSQPPEAGRVMAGALSFKSPYRTDMTVNVVDVLSALESWARTPRLGGVHNFTYGELEIGARMAREALAASPLPPVTPAAEWRPITKQPVGSEGDAAVLFTPAFAQSNCKPGQDGRYELAFWDGRDESYAQTWCEQGTGHDIRERLEDWGGEGEQPTHWFPLPSAPAVPATSIGGSRRESPEGAERAHD